MLSIVQFPQISTPEDQRRNATELYNPFTLKELKESYDVSLGLVVLKSNQDTFSVKSAYKIHLSHRLIGKPILTQYSLTQTYF